MEEIQNVLGSNSGSTSAIPGLDRLQGMLGMITIVSVVLGGLFMALYIFGLVQRARADRAMIAMNKDIAAIKALLEQQVQAPATKPTSTPPATVGQPEAVASQPSVQ